jgi:hypothetical protein
MGRANTETTRKNNQQYMINSGYINESVKKLDKPSILTPKLTK